MKKCSENKLRQEGCDQILPIACSFLYSIVTTDTLSYMQREQSDMFPTVRHEAFPLSDVQTGRMEDWGLYNFHIGHSPSIRIVSVVDTLCY